MVPSAWCCEEAIELLGGGALLKEVHHWERGLRIDSLTPFPILLGSLWVVEI